MSTKVAKVIWWTLFVVIMGTGILAACAPASAPERVSVNPAPLGVGTNMTRIADMGHYDIYRYADFDMICIVVINTYSNSASSAVSCISKGE